MKDRQALDRLDSANAADAHVRQTVERTAVARVIAELEERDRRRMEDRRAEMESRRSAKPRLYETHTNRPKSPVTLPTKPFDWRG
jgi:hypothetical protein